MTPWWRLEQAADPQRGRDRGPPCGSASTRRAVQITFIRPVSSSRLRKIVPFAVAGCWRCVTTPATSTTVRSGELAQLGGGDDAPCASSSLAHELGGVPARRQPVAQRSAAVSSTSVIPGSVRRLGAGDHARAACRAARRATRPRPTAPARRSTAEARERARGGERLERVDGRAGAAGEVLEVGNGCSARARRRCGRAARRAARARSGARAAPRGSTGRRASPARGRPTGPAASVRGSSVQSRRDASTHGPEHLARRGGAASRTIVCGE